MSVCAVHSYRESVCIHLEGVCFYSFHLRGLSFWCIGAYSCLACPHLCFSALLSNSAAAMVFNRSAVQSLVQDDTGRVLKLHRQASSCTVLAGIVTAAVLSKVVQQFSSIASSSGSGKENILGQQFGRPRKKKKHSRNTHDMRRFIVTTTAFLADVPQGPRTFQVPARMALPLYNYYGACMHSFTSCKPIPNQNCLPESVGYQRTPTSIPSPVTAATPMLATYVAPVLTH